MKISCVKKAVSKSWICCKMTRVWKRQFLSPEFVKISCVRKAVTKSWICWICHVWERQLLSPVFVENVICENAVTKSLIHWKCHEKLFRRWERQLQQQWKKSLLGRTSLSTVGSFENVRESVAKAVHILYVKGHP